MTALKMQLTKTRSLSGRRRAVATYMTEEMLELAIQVREQFRSTDVDESIENLATELDVNEYSLKHFLGGDEGKLIRLALHEKTKAALELWVVRQRLKG